MSKHDDYLQSEHDKCQEIITKSQELAKDELEPSVERFQRNILAQIPQQFGDFLYVALGDRVTGQRQSVINQDYLHNNDHMKEIAAKAETNGVTIEEQVAAEVKAYNQLQSWEKSYHNSTYNQHQLWISTGRKFGVSYLTGENADRFHTIYFGEGHAFEYLTQEHVDLVKNKLKRECAQSFLDYRNEYICRQAAINDKFIDVDVPIQLGIVSCVEKTTKINDNAGTYRENVKTFHVMDDITESKITHIAVRLNEAMIWNKKSKVSDVKGETNHHPTYFSIMFYNIDNDKQTISQIGNVDMSINEVCTGVQLSDKVNCRVPINHISLYRSNNYDFRRDEPIYSSGFQMFKVVGAGGVLLNMDEVLQHPSIKSELDKVIDFYVDMSEKLQQLKHKNSTLYFINSDL